MMNKERRNVGPRLLALALGLSACEGASMESATDVDSTTDDVSTTGEAESSTTTSETSGSVDEPICGDGVIEADELCDGAELGAHTCASEGFVDGGELTCTDACAVDASSCVACSSWLRQFGTYGFDSGRAVAVDDDTNVYVVGSVEYSLENEGSFGGRDAFIRRYTSTGVEEWTQQFGSDAQDSATAIAIDSASSIYVAGSTHGSVDGATPAGDADIMLFKFAADGSVLWTRQYGSAETDSVQGLVVDSLDHVYVAGYTGGSLDGNQSAGKLDIYLSKFTPDGDKLWTVQLGTSEDDYAWGAAIDEDDHIYVVGDTLGSFAETSHGALDAIAVKLDADGEELWRRQFGTPADDSIESVAIGIGGSVYTAGFTTGAFGGFEHQGDGDIFMRMLDPDGEPLSTTQFGTGSADVAYSVSTLSDGGYYLATLRPIFMTAGPHHLSMKIARADRLRRQPCALFS